MSRNESEVCEDTSRRVLDDVPCILPTADFLSESSGDEHEEVCGSHNVFSRSDHIKSLDLCSEVGLEGLDLESDVVARKSHEAAVSQPSIKEVTNSDTQQKVSHDVNADYNGDEETDLKSWDEFRTEFDDILRVSEEKVASGELQCKIEPTTSSTSNDPRHDILIELITALHGSRHSSMEDSGVEADLSQRQGAGLRPKKQLLSLSTLETIHESEIDRLLETVETVENAEADANLRVGVDSDVFSLTDGESASPLSPHSKLQWGMVEGSGRSNDELMEQLHRLSLDQASGRVGLGDQEGEGESSEMSTETNVELKPDAVTLNPSHPNKESENPTVVIDLRQKNDTNNRSQRCDSEDSDDDDDDDVYTWAQERRRLKSDLEASTNSSHTPSTSIHHAPSSASTTHHTPSTTHHAPPTSKLSHNLHQAHKVSSHAAQLDNRTKPHEDNKNNSLRSDKVETAIEKQPLESVPSLSAHKSTGHDEKVENSGVVEPEQVSVNQGERSSDSLTLSSSFSDGSSSCSGDQLETPKGSARTPSSGSSTAKKSSKQSKKSKKSRKKEQIHSKEKTERSLASQRRKAHVLQRIRMDSLNTSSDEENSLTPLTNLLSPVESSEFVAMSSSVSSGKEAGEVALDAENVKLDLQRRIMSKKPPAHFETPATDPVFHEGVSFSQQLMDMNPSSNSSGLLVLPLTYHGLTSLPSPWSELEADIHITLHCLVLTGLTCQAALDCGCGGSGSQVEGEGSDVNKMEFSLPFNFPFWITGMQQTVLDGHPSILISIQMREDGNSDRTDLVYEDAKEVDGFLLGVSIGVFLQPLIGNKHTSGAIPPSHLSSLEGVLSQPLSILLAYQDGISPLTSPISFYWHSTYHPSFLPSNESLKSSNSVTMTVCTLNSVSLADPRLILTVFQRVFASGLDIAGVRLLFGDHSMSVSSVELLPSLTGNGGAVSTTLLPTLALALRGPDAVYRWMDVVGPDDSTLARVTDPTSISATFGSGLVLAVRSPYQSTAALAKWFGGRACLKTGTVFGMSDHHTKSERRKRQRVRFSESESEDSISSPLPDVMFPPLICNRPRLIAQPYLKSLLVISPSIPPSCYGCVLSSCCQLGFDIFGAKRIRLNTKRAIVLEISGDFVSHFTPSSTPPSPAILDPSTQPPLFGGVFMPTHAPPPLPSVIFIIGRENSNIHHTTLKILIARNLQLLVQSNDGLEIERSLMDYPNAIAHLVPFGEEKVKLLGSFAVVVCGGSSQPVVDVDSNDLQEELCFVAMPGVNSLLSCVGMLDRVFNLTPACNDPEVSDKESLPTCRESSAFSEFEMVGMRIVPQLARFHAKKLCLLSADDPLYSKAVQLLSDVPASVFIFRGICCNKRISHCISLYSKASSHVVSLEQRLQFIVSRSSAEGVHLSGLFFSGKDLFSDTRRRVLTAYLPEVWSHESDILQGFLNPRETLFSVVQLPLTQMKLVVKVLGKLSRSGFAFAGISAVELSVESESILEEEEDSCAAEACIAVCLEKVNCVWHLQHLVLPFTEEGQRSGLKCSENFYSAISDLKTYFPDGIHTQEMGTVVKSYNIKALPEDSFDNITLSRECRKKLKASSSSPSFTYISPLLERTVIVLPPTFLSKHRHTPMASVHGVVHVLDFLCQSKFEICGMKMVLLSSNAAQELKLTLSLDVTLESLTCSPCLVIVLERDNAASCFQLIAKSALQSFHGQVESMSQLLSEVIAPNNLKQANQLLSFFTH